ncbi:MAG TPA: hypothetical protein VFL14_02490 [Xanthomonadales bacterium]|nr:hypothetical protein [Xanthomonadales bacterium]
MFAGQEIRDADREADDVAALGLQALGLFGDDHDRARLGATHPLGKLEHLGSSARKRQCSGFPRAGSRAGRCAVREKCGAKFTMGDRGRCAAAKTVFGMPGSRISALLALLALLAGCASTPPVGHGIEPDAAVGNAVAATARAVAGRDVPVVVHVGTAVRAELRPDHVLHVWRGLLLRTRDVGELAFALAHELAHDELAHPFPARGSARNVDQELAADARARETMARAGFGPGAGATLLRALRDEALVMDADAGALAELDRRLAAFDPDAALYSLRGDDPWRGTWAAHHAQWLAADPASADPRRRAIVARRVPGR